MRITLDAISLILVLAASSFAAAAEPVVGDTAADWTLVSAEGESITLSEAVADQPVVLFFWASWCPYCEALMPHLQSMRFENGERMEVLALNFRDDEGDPATLLQKAGYDFTLIPNAEETAGLYNVWGTPGVLIVDRNMKVRFNLYNLPSIEPPDTGEASGHRTRASYLAMYWAAEIRKTLRAVLGDED
ncbi:MAG: redoxin domain-containing protein [Woeseia sp.]